jgi:hypothetical protein
LFHLNSIQLCLACSNQSTAMQTAEVSMSSPTW